ncbi:Diacylglycerol O-acyltransferase [Pseudomonas pohangensis]|uniref:diacylglycerol O-acyltransferase n=1 Tax=Pseudomonas pohangensis TaxID=364197 RepID=A0A1H2F4K7_9PSED|nr:wax ester/triacylglycerol synthase family O-acyltransferase [Pseudomonas pohangensis]SDU02310.1 Diacylglycerol O-acyltransferase [Pseudomonas pohangensis]
MKQLSGSDNIFLFQEQKNVFNHVASLMIFDVSTAPEGRVRFKDILKHFDDRMYLHPIFRQRLANAPFGIDRPYWVADKDIDVEYHIRHIALPEPGDWRQLMIQVARLHSRPLDRSRPLWEAYIIEGLDNIPKLPKGSFAMFMKFHHASVDGMAGLHLASQLLSLSPTTAAPSSEQRTVYVDRDPSSVEFVSRAVSNGISRVLQAGKLSARLASKVVEIGSEQLMSQKGSSNPDEQLSFPKAPPTRFDTEVSAHRVFDGFGMPLSRIKRVREKVPGATLNDIFLAVAGGAVRKYLKAKKELPEESLLALMPMTLRTDASAGGNSIGAATVRVCSDIEDPLERLQAAHHAAKAGKFQAEKLGLDLFSKLLDTVPSFVGDFLTRKMLLQSLNMTVSNVRGPDVAMYLAGAKAMCLYPVSIPTNGAGLNLTGVSYNRVMWLSMVSCREMVPDPAFFIACMQEAWDELLAAADALPVIPPAKAKPAAKAASTRKPTARVAAAKKTAAAKPATAKTAATKTATAKPAAKAAVRKPAAAKKPVTQSK